jgi:membrane protease YdiL (CAAX protease family)
VQGFSAGAVTEVALLLGLNFVFVLVLVGADALASSAGIHLPQSKLEVVSPVEVVLVVLVAPPIEELIFRSWLTGRLVQLVISISVVLLFLALMIVRHVIGPLAARTGVAVLACWAVWTAGEVALVWKSRSDVPKLFRSMFPAAFWLSCFGFASLHLFNFTGAMRPVFVLMVMPQFVTGTILAFARLRYGMWANIALHCFYNGVLVLIAVGFG